MTTITRTSLRHQVAGALRQRLLLGGLAPGQRVNETALAAELDVSQTPVREALLTLEREGFLESTPGRGFTVRPLQAGEVREIYPILGHLEAFALRTGGCPDDVTLDELNAINADMRTSLQDPEKLFELDQRWHGSIMAHVSNRRLIEMIEVIRANVARYEYAFFRSEGRAVDSTHQHDDILRYLRANDLDAAAIALERNWTESPGPLLTWLEERGV